MLADRERHIFIGEEYDKDFEGGERLHTHHKKKLPPSKEPVTVKM